MAGKRYGRVDIGSAISRVCAKVLRVCNKMRENSSAMGKESLSSSFAVGTWNIGYDIDTFVAFKKKDGASRENNSGVS
jgi:hypothetical protein